MDFKEITDLIKLVSKSNLIQFKLKKDDFEITILTDKHGKSRQEEGATTKVPAPVSAPVVPAAPAVAAPPSDVPVPKSAQEDSAAAEAPSDDYKEIRSPMVGTFYRSPSPDKPPYIKVGDSIEAGDVVCIVEAMKLFNEIESEISGKIVKVLAEDASPVEYDQVLFLVES